METNKNELETLSRSLFNAAELLYSQDEFTAAVTLYFKALFIYLDVKLLRVGRRKPKDHVDRFAMLSRYLPTEYYMLNKLFPIYRQTYSKRVKEYNVRRIREYVREKISQFAAQGSKTDEERVSL